MIRRTPPDAHCRADFQCHVDNTVLELLNSVEFRDECVRLDAIMDGKIAVELNDLGWSLCDPGWELSFGEDFAATLGEEQ